MRKIPSAKPYFTSNMLGRILDDISEILKNGQLILGEYTERFEKMFSEYIGVKYAVSTSSCSAALEIVLRYFDIREKEVIVPTNTFIACPNSIIYAGGRPVFVDMNKETFCLNYGDIRKKLTSKTKGIIAVHIGGLPVPEIFQLKELCLEHRLFLLEDCSHSHGAKIDGVKVGGIGEAGCFSFFATKILTTGLGGIITTNDKNLYEYALSVRRWGGVFKHRKPEKYVRFGSDWLIDEIRAAIGIHQLERLEENIGKRINIAKKYAEAIEEFGNITFYRPEKNIRHVYWRFLSLLNKAENKEKILENLRRVGIEAGTLYPRPCHMHPLYIRLGYRNSLCPIAEKYLPRQLTLPIHSQMKNSDVEYVIKNLKTELTVV